MKKMVQQILPPFLINLFKCIKGRHKSKKLQVVKIKNGNLKNKKVLIKNGSELESLVIGGEHDKFLY